MADPRWTVGSNQYKRTLRPISDSSEPEVGLVAANPYMSFGPELLKSRAILLDVLRRLSAQADAVTVLGAHAVWEQTKHVSFLPPMDSTNDADLGISPKLLLDTPLVSVAMEEAGLELANPSRPGVWGLASEAELPLRSRLTIDLIVPASVAGKGTRSADTGEHGKHIASRTEGTELSLLDRQWLELESFDGGEPRSGWVAGHAALICAKVYKISDRLDPKELARNPERYKPKDIADVFRLVVASDGAAVRQVFEAGIARDNISAAVTEGKRRLLALASRDNGRFITGEVMQQWGDTLTRDFVQQQFSEWFAAFGP